MSTATRKNPDSRLTMIPHTWIYQNLGGQLTIAFTEAQYDDGRTGSCLMWTVLFGNAELNTDHCHHTSEHNNEKIHSTL